MSEGLQGRGLTLGLIPDMFLMWAPAQRKVGALGFMAASEQNREALSFIFGHRQSRNVSREHYSSKKEETSRVNGATDRQPPPRRRRTLVCIRRLRHTRQASLTTPHVKSHVKRHSPCHTSCHTSCVTHHATSQPCVRRQAASKLQNAVLQSP